ncbi:Density-regulated [Nymphon striatum]|nr:Density-regulated [Nymphon striatum]
MMAQSGETEVVSEKQNVFPIGPLPDVSYPLHLIYCGGELPIPFQYCEYQPTYEKCKQWLEKNLPDEFNKMMKLMSDGDGSMNDDEKKRQKRGGKGVVKAKKKAAKEKRICLTTAPRGKKKFVTIVSGLSTYDIDLKKASKYFANKFSCGSSVTGDDEIVIQGDVKYDLFDIITEKWPEVDEDLIEDLGEQKR